MATEPAAVPPRPRGKSARAKADAANGHDALQEPVALPPEPDEPDPADLADWSRGAAALARLPARIKLQMLDAVDDVRRAAQAEMDGKAAWLERLRYETEEMLASGIGARLGARVLTSVSTDPPDPLLLGRLDPTGHTILFGTGGVGKGTLASSWALGLLTEGRRLLILDYENHPEEWARRIHGMGGDDRLDQILHVAPLTAAWGGKRGAIWAQAEDIRRLALDWHTDYVMIDSIVPACAGSDPLKPESVSLYAGALEYIGLPALSLGHVTKADDLRYPFGSIFWHNLSRTTYSLKADAGTVVLQHRKHNNYVGLPAQKVEVQWSPSGVPLDVYERAYAEVLARRISEVLIGQAEGLTVKQIVAALHELDPDDDADPPSSDSISKALRRGARLRPPKFTKQGSDRWSNV